MPTDTIHYSLFTPKGTCPSGRAHFLLRSKASTLYSLHPPCFKAYQSFIFKTKRDLDRAAADFTVFDVVALLFTGVKYHRYAFPAVGAVKKMFHNYMPSFFCHSRLRSGIFVRFWIKFRMTGCSFILFVGFFKPFGHPIRQGTSAAIPVSFTSCQLYVSPKHKGKAQSNDEVEWSAGVVAVHEALYCHDEEEDGDDEAHG